MYRMRAALAAGLALLTAAACTGGGGEGGGEDGEEHGKNRAKPPRLKQLWSVSAPVSDARAGGPWLGHGILATRVGTDDRSLSGYATSSGDRRWTLRLPEGTDAVCGISETVNSAGIGGVVLNATRGERRCSVAAAVDIRAGKVLWTERVGDTIEDMGDEPPVSVSGKTLTVTVRYHKVARFRLEGDAKRRALPRLPHVPEGESAVDGIDHDGTHIALQTRSGFALYDADKGTRLWHRPAERRGGALEGLVSADPVVLDATEKGHRFFRAYGAGPGNKGLLGKELSRVGVRAEPLTGRGVLVTDFADDPRTYAYDMRTGEQLWARKRTPAQKPLFVRGGGVLFSRPYLAEQWLVSRDLRGGEQRTLGRLTGTASRFAPVAADSRRLYATGQRRDGTEALFAYALPRTGTDRRYAAPRTPGTGGENPLAVKCEKVSDTALRTLRLNEDRPPPESCWWKEEYEPDDVSRELDVTVEEHGTRKEAEKAYRDPTHLRSNESLGRARPVRGLGDQARAITFGGSREYNSVRLLVRTGTRTLAVETHTESSGGQPSSRDAPDLRESERGALRAAADVLRTLDAGPAPKPPDRLGKEYSADAED
ncbi:hypothetical protein GCM10009801_27120 [Streptomyces albiaxialis]|uniref:Pyrrolo-quinoline quinone repeat domain-containing protein n=1 Tax=Streptomyces albiaxialis TaxID=329523 RepID=A0ABN2VV07_9ACTN